MILVTIINGEDLSLSHSKLFVDSDNAKNYFIQICKEYFPNESKVVEEDEWDGLYDDGYFADMTHFSVYVQEVNVF